MNSTTALFVVCTILMVPSWCFVFWMEAHLIKILPAECNLVLDTLFKYEPERVYKHIACMGETGRAFYWKFQTMFDLPLPFIYGVFHYGSLTFLWPEAINFMRVFSLLTSVFDLMENTSTLVTLSKFPEKDDTLALFMSTFCQIKWFLALVTGGVILLGLIRLAFRKLVSSKQPEAKKIN